MQSVLMARPAIIFHSVHHKAEERNRKVGVNGRVCRRYRVGLDVKSREVLAEPAGGGARTTERLKKAKV